MRIAEGSGPIRLPLCDYCEEPLIPGEQPFKFMHRECVARSMHGSIACVEQRCGCYVPGSDEGDPPGLTRREAARLVLDWFLNKETEGHS